MKAEEIKINFAKNIKFLRNSKNMSQEKLGKVLGYSDKSISKWECGDVLPDVITMNLIADYFSITINDLLSSKIHVPFNQKVKHVITSLITLFGILSVAGLMFFFFSSFSQMQRPWLIFIFSLPFYFLVMIVLSSIFFDYKAVITFISLLTWTLITSLYLLFLPQNFYFLFVVVAFLQVVYIFLGIIIFIYKKNKSLKQQHLA